MNASAATEGPERVPAPPGGHALRIDPELRARQQSSAASQLPVVEETSAGGLVAAVIDGATRVAVIGRRNRAGRLEWCLPKGHLEGDETPEEAAVREIAEETGILGEIRGSLGVIDYWFSGDGRRVHKAVHHFLLEACSGVLTVEGDPDGEAEVVEWIALDALSDRLSYPNERRLAADVLAARADGSPLWRGGFLPDGYRPEGAPRATGAPES